MPSSDSSLPLAPFSPSPLSGGGRKKERGRGPQLVPPQMPEPSVMVRPRGEQREREYEERDRENKEREREMTWREEMMERERVITRERKIKERMGRERKY